MIQPCSIHTFTNGNLPNGRLPWLALASRCCVLALYGTPLTLAPAWQVDVTDVGDPLKLLEAGSVRSVEFSGGGRVVVDAPRPGRVYLPGSFNPLHAGHRRACVQRRHT